MPQISESRQYQQSLAVVANATDANINQLFEAASRDAQRLIGTLDPSSGIGAATRRQQLVNARTQLNGISSAVWSETGDVIKTGAFQGASLAADQLMDLDMALGMPSNVILGYAEGMQFNAALAAEAVVQNKTHGFTLNQRVYRNSQATTSRAMRVVDSGLLLGRSAKEIAADVRKFIDPATPGGASYAANRLARTEINNGYHEANKAMMERRPWIDFVQWHLSGSHPEADICDTIAEGGDHPQNAGQYKSSNVPRRPHPQCICFITAVTPTPEKFLDDLVDGEFDDFLDAEGLAC